MKVLVNRFISVSEKWACDLHKIVTINKSLSSLLDEDINLFQNWLKYLLFFTFFSCVFFFLYVSWHQTFCFIFWCVSQVWSEPEKYPSNNKRIWYFLAHCRFPKLIFPHILEHAFVLTNLNQLDMLIYMRTYIIKGKRALYQWVIPMDSLEFIYEFSYQNIRKHRERLA